MFKNALVYRITQWDAPALAALEERLAANRFVACGASQPESSGWVEPRGERHGALAESIGGQWMLQLCTETKAVPASAVRTQLDAQLEKIESETGRKPRGRRAREIKEEIVHQLLPRAFPKRALAPVWIDPHERRVVIGAASATRADAVVTRLVEAMGGGVVLRPLQTTLSPQAAMSAWLADQAAPAGFSLDRECELKQPDSEKAAVRYARHSLEIDEIAAHIAQGKRPTQLALTWNARVSFVLTESMAIKKLKVLDVDAASREGAARGQDSPFDADVALTTGELAPMIGALVEALGGEQDLQPAAPAGGPDAARPAANDEPMAA
jgi:recombination associated protein RdgC